MALTITPLTNGNGTANPAVTASVAFSNNVLYLLFVSTAGAASDITGVTGGGITWTKVNGTAASSESISCWRGIVASGATTGTLSITGTATTRISHDLISVTGSSGTAANNGSDAIPQSAFQARTANATSSSVTLAAFADAANNAAINYVYVHLSTETITKEGAYTSLLVDPGTGISQMAAYFIGQDTTVTSTWTNLGTVMALALEVSVPITPPSSSHKNLSLTGVG